MTKCTWTLWLGIFAAFACSKSKTESIAASSAQIVAGVDDAGVGHTGLGPNGVQKQEPSADFIDSRTLVVGFNIPNDQGWAVSHDLGHSFTQQCSFGGANLLDGGACPPVPPPPGGTLPWQWSGDPVVRADGRGNLVYLSLGDPTTDQDAAHFIVAAVSSNGAASFASSVLVNDAGCGSSGVSPAVDQPNATFDFTTDPPTLWVVYRFFGAGTQTFAGACVRRGVVDTTGTPHVRWLDQARSVDGLGASGFGLPYTYGVAIAAGDGVVTVMSGAGTSFMPNSNGKNPHDDPCPDDNPDPNGMAWATVDSFDNGMNWVDNAKIFHSERTQWCVLAESPNTRGGSLPTVGKVLMGLRSFGIARAPGGIEYAVLQDTNTTARLFMSPAAGIKGWQNPTSTIRTWYEWCPGTPTSDASAGPTSNWKSTGTGNGDAPACATPAIQPAQGGAGALPRDLVWPTIAADGRGNIA